MKIFEVIVVGGGVIGACTAAILSELGIEVLLVESDTCAGRGASAFSGGIIRFYDPDPIMMQLSALANKVLRERNVGRVFEKSIRRSGMLYRTPAAEFQNIKDSMAEFGRREDQWSFLSHSQLRKLTDFVHPDRAKLDYFEKDSGFSDVRFATHSLAHLVRNTGQVLEHTKVACVADIDSALAMVQLQNGTKLYSRIVVVATGAWLAQLIDGLPIVARTIPLAVFETSSAPHFPVIDAGESTYAVPLGRSIFGIGCSPRATERIPDNLPAVSDMHSADAGLKLDALASRELSANLLAVHRGFDSYTPDNRPFVGFTGDESCVYAMSGFSGLGFKIAPAVAEIAASQIQARLRKDHPPETEVALALDPRRAWGLELPHVAGGQEHG